MSDDERLPGADDAIALMSRAALTHHLRTVGGTPQAEAERSAREHERTSSAVWSNFESKMRVGLGALIEAGYTLTRGAALMITIPADLEPPARERATRKLRALAQAIEEGRLDEETDPRAQGSPASD